MSKKHLFIDFSAAASSLIVFSWDFIIFNEKQTLKQKLMPAWSVEVWLKSIPFYRIYTYLVTEHSNSKKQHFSASSVDTTSKLEMQHKVFEINWNWCDGSKSIMVENLS
jgi:hypothetical protein